MTLPAGRFRERVVLQSPPAADDGAGGQTGGWTNVATVRAAVEPMRGEEMVLAGADIGVVKYQVTIRRRAVSAAQRLLWAGPFGTLRLDIRSVQPDPGRVDIVLLCDAVPG